MVKSKKSYLDSTGKDPDAPFKAASIVTKSTLSPFKHNAKASLSFSRNNLINSKKACVLKMAIVGDGRVVVSYFMKSDKPALEPFTNQLKVLVEQNEPGSEDLYIFQTRLKRNTPPGDGNISLPNQKNYPWSVFAAYKNDDYGIWDRESCYERALKICSVSISKTTIVL